MEFSALAGSRPPVTALGGASVPGRSSNLKGAARRKRRPCRPPLTSEPLRPSGTTVRAADPVTDSAVVAVKAILTLMGTAEVRCPGSPTRSQNPAQSGQLSKDEAPFPIVTR
jgi:hypothetical protein